MNPDDYLMLSGVQHYAFCPRQWALIHVEQLWAENALTFSGKLMHDNADDPFFVEARGDTLVSRSIPLVSHNLKIYGIADVVEFHRSPSGVRIANRDGFWEVVPLNTNAERKKRMTAMRSSSAVRRSALKKCTGQISLRVICITEKPDTE